MVWVQGRTHFILVQIQEFCITFFDFFFFLNVVDFSKELSVNLDEKVWHTWDVGIDECGNENTDFWFMMMTSHVPLLQKIPGVMLLVSSVTPTVAIWTSRTGGFILYWDPSSSILGEKISTFHDPEQIQENPPICIRPLLINHIDWQRNDCERVASELWGTINAITATRDLNHSFAVAAFPLCQPSVNWKNLISMEWAQFIIFCRSTDCDMLINMCFTDQCCWGSLLF